MFLTSLYSFPSRAAEEGPTFSMKSTVEEGPTFHMKDDLKCPACCDEYSYTGGLVPMMMKCGHSICDRCLSNQQVESCPMCNSSNITFVSKNFALASAIEHKSKQGSSVTERIYNHEKRDLLDSMENRQRDIIQLSIQLHKSRSVVESLEVDVKNTRQLLENQKEQLKLKQKRLTSLQSHIAVTQKTLHLDQPKLLKVINDINIYSPPKLENPFNHLTKTVLSAKCSDSTEQSLQTNLFAASSSDMTCAPDKSSPVVLKTRSKKFTYSIQAPDPPTFLQENLKQFTTSGDKFVFSLPSSENGPSSEALSPKRLESTEQSLQISTVCLP